MRHNASVSLQHAVPILVGTITRSCPLRPEPPLALAEALAPGCSPVPVSSCVKRSFTLCGMLLFFTTGKKWIEKPYSHRWIATDRDRPGRAKCLLASVHVAYHAQDRQWSLSRHSTGNDYDIAWQ